MLFSLTLSALLLFTSAFGAHPRRSRAIPSLLESESPRLYPRDLSTDACSQIFQGNGKPESMRLV